MKKIKIYIVEGTQLDQLPQWIKSPKQIGTDTVEAYVSEEDLAMIVADAELITEPREEI